MYEIKVHGPSLSHVFHAFEMRYNKDAIKCLHCTTILTKGNIILNINKKKIKANTFSDKYLAICNQTAKKNGDFKQTAILTMSGVLCPAATNGFKTRNVARITNCQITAIAMNGKLL